MGGSNITERDDDCREGDGDCKENKKGYPVWIVWVIGALLLGTLVWSIARGDQQAAQSISYSEFRDQVKGDNVARVVVQGDRIEGEYIAPQTEVGDEGQITEYEKFLTFLPSFEDAELMPLLEKHAVEVQTRPRQTISWFGALLSLAPLLFILMLGLMIFRRMPSGGDGIMSLTKSRARQYDPAKKRITFADVAGSGGVKQELQEVIDYLRDPDRFQRLGAEMPRGVLLAGPPGTGKTLLARAVAGEANVPFFSLSGSDFVEVYVGVGASRVRDMFAQAKKNSPAILFIDELDSIGRRRSGGGYGGNDEREQTLNQLLSEMDGFDRSEHVIVMAATNRPDILDSALRRPGRFDRQVVVDTPTALDRLEILKIHSKNKPLAEDVDLERVARSTPGFSGADLANLLNEAALLSARRDKDAISNAELDEAQDKVFLGLERNVVMTEEEARLVAYHETGHALVAAVLPNADPVHKVTIIPRGRAMGVTQQLPEHERYLYPKEYLLDRMAVLMGGRAAEELFINSITTGAENDLRQATSMARKMVVDWGMSERLGRVALSSEGAGYLSDDPYAPRVYSEATAREIDEEIRILVEEAYSRARNILHENSDAVERIVNVLIEQEEITGAELMAQL